jgi:DNA-binding XRE family transcriptional regulator
VFGGAWRDGRRRNARRAARCVNLYFEKYPWMTWSVEVLIEKHGVAAMREPHVKQAQLAKKMGTSQSTIARLESGSAKPSLSTLERFAKATGMTMRVVFEPAKPKKRRPRRAA